MDDTNKNLSVDSDLIIVRKFNDDCYTTTLLKGYYKRKKVFKEYDWMLYGGEFKKAIAVTKKTINGVDYFADVDGNLLHDNDGSIRFYEEYKPIEHSDKKLEQSISRSKRMIKELAMCNDWELFVTLTGDKEKIDRTNVETFKQEWQKFVHAYNKRPSNKDCKLKYLLVPEYHEDKAIHFHGYFMGGNPKDYFINEHGYLDFKPYRTRFGWFNGGKIRSLNKCANYSCKYITKELASCVGIGKQCYICSQGLKRSEIILYGSNIIVGDDWSYENDHVKKNTYYDDSFLQLIEIA